MVRVSSSLRGSRAVVSGTTVSDARHWRINVGVGQMLLGVITLGLAACGATSPPASSKEGAPRGPITLVVPLAAGGGLDLAARAVAPVLAEELPGHPNVVVEDEPGANGAVGMDAVANAPANGDTLGIAYLPNDLVPLVAGKATYHVKWVAGLAAQPQIAVVSTKLGVSTLRELQTAAARTPLVEASGGALSGAAFVDAVSASRLRLPMRPVAIPGAGATRIADLVQGEVNYETGAYSDLGPYLYHGLVPLWVYAPHRLPKLPRVPTISEEGYPALTSLGDYEIAIAQPLHTPAPTASIIAQAIKRVASSKSFEKSLAKMSLTSDFMDSTEVTALADKLERAIGPEIPVLTHRK